MCRPLEVGRNTYVTPQSLYYLSADTRRAIDFNALPLDVATFD